MFIHIKMIQAMIIAINTPVIHNALYNGLAHTLQLLFPVLVY